MSWERAARLVWAVPVLTLCFEAAFLAIADYPDAGSEGVEFLFLLTFMTYSVVGALIASRHPRNPVGWLFCFVGVFFAGSEALYAYARDPTGPAGADIAAWVQSWTGEPVAVVVVLLVLLFPDGHFLSPRWRRAGVAAVVACVVWAVALALNPGPLQAVETISNPFGIDGTRGVLDAVAAFGPLVLAFSIGLALAGVIVRFRRARARERRQLKWLALAAGYLIAVVVVTIALVLAFNTDEGAWDFVVALLICSGIAALPVAAALAILRERLYDIDVVINRALVYGALTATLAATYLGQRGADRAGGRPVRVRRRGLDARGRGTLPPRAGAHPGGGRPSLLPPPLRRRADARGLRRPAARRGRARRAEPASCAA